jgi:hypothetical protein
MQNIVINNRITAQVEVPHLMISMIVIFAILAVSVWLALPRRPR